MSGILQLPHTIQSEDGQHIYDRRVALPIPENRVVLLGDEDIRPDGKGRTADGGFVGPCTPSVMRFEKTARPPSSDYRVNISPLNNEIHRINGYDEKAVEYLYADWTALFNNTGYPMQAYLLTQGNQLEVMEYVTANGVRYCKFKTLTPDSITAGMTNTSHPEFVHFLDLVCYKNDHVPATWHKTVIKPTIQVIYYFLVSREGYGYIPAAWVRPA